VITSQITIHLYITHIISIIKLYTRLKSIIFSIFVSSYESWHLKSPKVSNDRLRYISITKIVLCTPTQHVSTVSLKCLKMHRMRHSITMEFPAVCFKNFEKNDNKKRKILCEWNFLKSDPNTLVTLLLGLN